MRGAEQRPGQVAFQKFDAGLPGGDTQANAPVPLRQLTEQQASPEVVELVSILYDAYSLQRNFSNAALNEQRFQPHTQPIQAVEAYKPPLQIDPSLAERCRRASFFVEATIHIMRGSFEAYPEEPEYLRTVLNSAFEPYGFLVAEGKGQYDILDHTDYTSALEQQISRYKQSRKDLEHSTDDLYFLLTDDDHFEKYGMYVQAGGKRKHDPEVFSYVERLNEFEKLEHRLGHFFNKSDSPYWTRDERGENTEPALPGLRPYYKERYAYALKIFQSLTTIMGNVGEKATNPPDLFSWPLSQIILTFNEALYDLDMHIDVNPQWRPEAPGRPVQQGRVIRIQEVSDQEDAGFDTEK